MSSALTSPDALDAHEKETHERADVIHRNPVCLPPLSRPGPSRVMSSPSVTVASQDRWLTTMRASTAVCRASLLALALCMAPTAHALSWKTCGKRPRCKHLFA